MANNEATAVPQVTIMPPHMMISVDSVPIYDGTSSIEEFLNIVEETGTLAEWTNKQLLAINSTPVTSLRFIRILFRG